MATIATTTPDIREFEFAGWRCRTGKRGTGLPARAQAEVIACLAAGMTQKEIARARGCSPNTVKSTVTALLYHLHAMRAAGAVAEAIRRGWIAPLLLALLVGAMTPGSDALRVRQPVRTRQQVSANSRISRRDTGSAYS